MKEENKTSSVLGWNILVLMFVTAIHAVVILIGGAVDDLYANTSVGEIIFSLTALVIVTSTIAEVAKNLKAETKR